MQSKCEFSVERHAVRPIHFVPRIRGTPLCDAYCRQLISFFEFVLLMRWVIVLIQLPSVLCLDFQHLRTSHALPVFIPSRPLIVDSCMNHYYFESIKIIFELSVVTFDLIDQFDQLRFAYSTKKRGQKNCRSECEVKFWKNRKYIAFDSLRLLPNKNRFWSWTKRGRETGGDRGSNESEWPNNDAIMSRTFLKKMHHRTLRHWHSAETHSKRNERRMDECTERSDGMYSVHEAACDRNQLNGFTNWMVCIQRRHVCCVCVCVCVREIAMCYRCKEKRKRKTKNVTNDRPS